jgi:hypothetical protein
MQTDQQYDVKLSVSFACGIKAAKPPIFEAEQFRLEIDIQDTDVPLNQIAPPESDDKQCSKELSLRISSELESSTEIAPPDPDDHSILNVQSEILKVPFVGIASGQSRRLAAASPQTISPPNRRSIVKSGTMTMRMSRRARTRL